MKLFLTYIGLEKHCGNVVTTSGVQGYRLCASEDEARGMATKAALDAKPNFSITGISIMQMPDEHVIAASDAILDAQREGPKA